MTTSLHAIDSLFERCRLIVGDEDVKRYAPNDPGVFTYVATYQAILRGDDGALEHAFVLSDTYRWCRASQRLHSMRFRWFRLLTNSIDLLTGWSISHRSMVAAPECLASILLDAFALAQANDKRLPRHLFVPICREVRHQFSKADRAYRAFGFLSELLALQLDPAQLALQEELCVMLESAMVQVALFSRAKRKVASLWNNPDSNRLQLVWLNLIERHFPTDSAIARELRARLLEQLAEWQGQPRTLD